MTRKIKILYTIPNFDTAGSGKVVYDLVSKLDKEKFSPEICCFHGKGAFFKEVEKLGVPIHIFPFTTTYKPYFSFFFRLYKIASFFRKNNFDIIHSWHWSSDFSEPLAAKMSKTPFVYTKKAMSWGNKAWKIRSWLSSKIIVLNSDMIPLFFDKIKRKVSLIYLGVDLRKYVPQPKTFKLPKGLEFESTDFIIVTIANLVPIKGIEYLIEAVNTLSSPSIKLLIVGNSKNNYGQELLRKHASNNILFIDKQLDVRPYHAIADLFVIPTLAPGEGLPVALIEAMAAKRIVIGSRVKGVKEVLNGFQDCLFEAKSSKSIIEKIEMIQNMSTQEKERLAEQMRIHVETTFSLSNCIKNHEKFYLELLK